MARFIPSMLIAAMTLTLAAGAAHASPRNPAPKVEPRSRPDHVGDRDRDRDHDRDGDRDRRGVHVARNEHVREVRVWRGERWVTIDEPIRVAVATPAPMTAWDLERRATDERSEANRLRGEARWERTFFMIVPADNAERRARMLDERAAADDAAARALAAARS